MKYQKGRTEKTEYISLGSPLWCKSAELHSTALRVTLERSKHHKRVNNYTRDCFPGTGCSYLTDLSPFIPATHNNLLPNHQKTHFKPMLSSELSAAMQERDHGTVINILWSHWLRVQRQPKKPAEHWLLSGRILMGHQSPPSPLLEILSALTSGMQFWSQLLRKKVMDSQRVQRRGGMSCLNKEQSKRLGLFN